MPHPTVAISIDSVCARQGKCYVSEIVAVAEEYRVPLTWLLGVQEHDPMTNAKLYHDEYLHRIPAWHEIGLHITFDTTTGNTIARGDLIRLGKEILKQFSIKPTAFRAGYGALEADDLAALEDIGILVDASPGSSASRPVNAPKSPYHPAYTNVHQPGDAKLWIVPVANVNGARGYLDDGFDRLKPVIDATLPETQVFSLGMCDCMDNATNLRHAISYLKGMGTRFTTLTQLVSEL